MINNRKLKRALKQLDADEALQLEQYKVAPDEAEDITHELDSFRGRILVEFDDKKRSLVAAYLLRKAEKKLIPRPEFNKKNWVKNEDDSYHLSDHAINELRSKIKIENNDSIEMIVKIIVGLTGVIGTLTGLIAIVKK